MAGGDRNCLTVSGPDGLTFGYGRMVTSFKEQLAKKVDLVDDAEVCVSMMTPNMVKGWWKGQRRVVFTMWETDILPGVYHEYVSMFDQVIVPCEHNKMVFSQYHDNVVVVPLGVDATFWKPATREPNERFRFLAGGSHWKRKGLDVVVEAWQRLNPAGAELVIKGTPDTIGGIPKIEHPSIIVHREWMTMEEERDLYRSADCFVAASRGEGWGLMPLQAMCAGVPVLMTDTTGHQVFSHLAVGLIDTVKESAVWDRFYTDGDWDSPTVESVMEQMTFVLDNREKVTEQGLKASTAARKFTWKAASDKLLAAVQPTSNRVDKSLWEMGDLVSVPITAKRRIVADIGKYRIRMEKGETQVVFPGVRDVLRDAGMIE